MNVLSLGAGVQSSVMALMLSEPDSPLHSAGYQTPDYAVFADTGWEPVSVYHHLDWLDTVLSYPVHRIQAGSIKTNSYAARGVDGHQFIEIPLFSTDDRGKRGMLRRQCTSAYKVRPIIRHIRESAGVGYRQRFPQGQRVDLMLGISVDEAERMKPAQPPWMDHRYPLIDAGISRADCQQWFSTRYPDRTLPRSACIVCPYRTDKEWWELSDGERQEAIEFDQHLRQPGSPPQQQCRDDLYLHQSRMPLAQALDRAAHKPTQLGLGFTEECEGFCGL